MEPRDFQWGQLQGLGKRPWAQAVFGEVVHPVSESQAVKRGHRWSRWGLGRICLPPVVGFSEAMEIYFFCSPWDPIKGFSHYVQFVCGVTVPMGFLKILIQASDVPVVIYRYHDSIILPWRCLSFRESVTCWMLKDPAQQCKAKTTYGARAPRY